MAETGMIRWCEDSDKILMGMDRETIREFDNLAEYTQEFGPYIDRLGWPTGKYFFHLPAEGKPASFESRALDPGALNDQYYQYEIVSLSEELRVRTGIVAPWFGMPGGARMVQFIWGNIPLTAEECIELGVLAGKAR